MSRLKFGEQTACRYCRQDIEWHGREHGWIDRGNNRSCVPYFGREKVTVIDPKPKHAPPKRTE